MMPSLYNIYYNHTHSTMDVAVCAALMRPSCRAQKTGSEKTQKTHTTPLPSNLVRRHQCQLSCPSSPFSPYARQTHSPKRCSIAQRWWSFTYGTYLMTIVIMCAPNCVCIRPRDGTHRINAGLGSSRALQQEPALNSMPCTTSLPCQCAIPTRSQHKCTQEPINTSTTSATSLARTHMMSARACSTRCKPMPWS